MYNRKGRGHMCNREGGVATWTTGKGEGPHVQQGRGGVTHTDTRGGQSYLCTCWSEATPVMGGTSPARPC